MNVVASLSRVGTESQCAHGPWLLNDVTFALLQGDFAAVVVSRSARQALRRLLDGSKQPTRGLIFWAAGSPAFVMPKCSCPADLATTTVDPFARVLIADEPTESLNGVDAEQVMNRLAALVRIGRTILLLTEDMDLARRHARRIIQIADGRVVRDADATLFASSKT